MQVPDRIEKEVVLDAPHDRVWSAVTDSEQFAAWSGMTFDGPFIEHRQVGAHLLAAATSSAGESRPVPVGWYIERLEPMRLFRFRWHPFPIDPTIDYSSEPMNTITLTVEPIEQRRTRLLVVEAGYDQIPAQRREQSFRGNDQGWDMQLVNLAEFLARGSDSGHRSDAPGLEAYRQVMNRDDAERLVLTFYDLFVNQRDFDAAVTYLGDPYVQHRADIPNDLDSLRAFNANMKQRFPQLHADVRRVFVDGDHVILHVHVVPEPDALGSAHVDIFRVADGEIVEHWDVDEPIPEHRAHDNPIV